MLLLTHISIAFASIALASMTFIKPSHPKLKASYALAALTFMSGTYLVVLHPSHLPTACLSGVAYLLIICAILFTAKNRLAGELVRIRSRRR